MSDEFPDNDPKWKYRLIKDKSSGVAKRHDRETAVRMIVSGNYEYADDGPYDPDTISAGWRRRMTSSPDAEIIVKRALNFQDSPPPKKDAGRISRLRTPAGNPPPATKGMGDIQIKPSPSTIISEQKKASMPQKAPREIDMSKLSPAQRKVLDAKKTAAQLPIIPQPGVAEGVNTLRSIIDRRRAERNAAR